MQALSCLIYVLRLAHRFLTYVCVSLTSSSHLRCGRVVTGSRKGSEACSNREQKRVVTGSRGV